jgi:protein-S-isoprenylcysteine O-methyltransferase Ste14
MDVRIMLESQTVAFLIIGALVTFGIGLPILLRFRGDKLPAGSVIIERSDQIDMKLESPWWAKLGVLFAMGGSIIVSVIYVILAVFDLWNGVLSSLVVNLPTWMNWFGLAGIWIELVWGSTVMYFNVNYLPLTRSIPNRYVLATGGPYRIVRHPMYFAYIILNISLFFATGLLILGFVALGWLAVRKQMAAEETALLIIFEEVYEKYQTRTSQLFPWM